MLIAQFLTYFFFIFASLFLVLRIVKESGMAGVFVLAFAIRIIVMYLDYFEMVQIPGNGDAYHFHGNALANQSTIDHFRDTNYVVFLTYFYRITDNSRLLAQYLNVLMGMTFLVYLNKTLRLSKVSFKNRKQIITIASFMPNLIFFSAILLREAWMEMFVMLSVYYFVKWYKAGGKPLYAILSILYVIMASWMHSGCLLIVMGYIVCFALYDRNTQSVYFSTKFISVFVLVCAIGFFLVTKAGDLFSKFIALQESTVMDTMIGKYATVEDAGSTYLKWLDVSSPIQAVVFAPLKMFYFLYSPIPLDWRSIMDVIAFMFDSSVYIFLSYWIYKNWKTVNDESKYLIRFLMISFILTTLVFSFGTSTSGTAIRHRAKICSILMVCYGLSRSTDEDRNKNIRYENSILQQ